MIETTMAANVGAMSKRSTGPVGAAPTGSKRAASGKESVSPARGGIAGRPAWSRAVHDRRGRMQGQEFRTLSSTSGCRWANPRFEPTCRQLTHRHVPHPSTRGSSASR